jgi:hypothetical protein
MGDYSGIVAILWGRREVGTDYLPPPFFSLMAMVVIHVLAFKSCPARHSGMNLSAGFSSLGDMYP